MYRILYLVFVLIIFSDCSTPILLQTQEESLSSQLFNTHKDFRESSINHRRFKHADIQPLIHRLGSEEGFRLKKLGESIEGRDITLISWGEGPIQVLMWSQMHGDEPTATMAIMDIFNLLTSDAMSDYKSNIKEKLTLHFIPMLNPDGAERYQRRNANGVDLNRDALRLQNPEAVILKHARDSLDADWGFNLHDQNRYYAVGLHPEIASISFLAPAYNHAKDINQGRGDAMRLIGKMNAVLQKYIPNKVGKYNDTFEPRAFGDNIQKWGTNTILIESGGIEEDREKQSLRQLNYVMLLSAFDAIASGSYTGLPLSHYNDIPFNNSNTFHELIIRKAQVERLGKMYTLDLAFRQQEVEINDEGEFMLKGYIADIGDLSTSYGYQELDASGYELSFGKVYPDTLENAKALHSLDALSLLRQGYTDVIISDSYFLKDIMQSPLKVHSHAAENNAIDMGKNPSLILSQNGSPKYAVIDGGLVEI